MLFRNFTALDTKEILKPNVSVGHHWIRYTYTEKVQKDVYSDTLYGFYSESTRSERETQKEKGNEGIHKTRKRPAPQHKPSMLLSFSPSLTLGNERLRHWR